MEERVYKGHEHSFVGDECVHYSDYGNGFTGIYMSHLIKLLLITKSVKNKTKQQNAGL